MARKVKDWVAAPWHRARRQLLSRPRVQLLIHDLQDAIDWVLARRDPLTPPRRLVHGIGAGLEVGKQFLGFFRELADLKPTERVLDVGCGVGRMAIPLTEYLTPPGRYDGFDIMRENVTWCHRALTPRFPNFQFRHADIFNREYNPRGKVRSTEYRFPYPDDSFDFVFLTSVFTHLLPEEIAHYTQEIARVLSPGGRALVTMFLLNAESEAYLAADRGQFALLPREQPHYRTTNRSVPEECIAIDEAFFHECVADAGLAVAASHYGYWCGRPDWFDYQDVMILTPHEGDPSFHSPTREQG